MNNMVNNVNKHFTHIENNYNVFNKGGWNNFANNWNNNNYWGNWHQSGRRYGNWYHGSWHGNYGNAWGYSAGLSTGVLVSSWMMGPTVYNTGYYSYQNPYYTQPLVIEVDGGDQTVIQYDQPLQASPPPQEYDSADTGAAPSTVSEESIYQLDEALLSFAEGDYDEALDVTNGVLAANPNDPIVHQLRALILFAQGEYRQASAALYAVLSVGPPWDWTTMSGLYSDTDDYAKQIAALENFTAENADAAYAHFLLGYHYMVCGYNEEAIAEYKVSVELEPSDQLAANLVTMLGGSFDDQEVAETEPIDSADIVEVDPNNLFGNWQSGRSNGPAISLELSEDGKFVWTVGEGSNATVLQGEFSLGGDKIALQPDEGSPMMGTVTDVTDGEFNFRVVGAPPGDKGLSFERS